jgi:valyl-tRNA synthetase
MDVLIFLTIIIIVHSVDISVDETTCRKYKTVSNKIYYFDRFYYSNSLEASFFNPCKELFRSIQISVKGKKETIKI